MTSVKSYKSVPSEGSIFRAKKLGGDGLVVSNWGFPIKICRQDVRFEFFKVAVQLITMNEDLWKDVSAFRVKKKEVSVICLLPSPAACSS